MESQKLTEQVELIRQVFGYVDQFREKTFVIKIESEIIHHAFFPVLVRDLVLLHRLGIRIILVPGARERIDQVLSQNRIKWRFVDGLRIMPVESMPFVKMAAFDVSNRIMTLLAENQTDAVIGNWVQARSIGIREGVDFESAGMVDKLKIGIIRTVLEQGLVPIFPNIGWNVSGKPYNLSSDELALQIAQEVTAEKLFFISVVRAVEEGEYRLPEGVEKEPEGRVSRFRLSEVQDFLNLNKEIKRDDRLLGLLTLGHRACRAGVRRVHILDGRNEGVILKEIFSSEGVGTMVYADEYSHIRKMTHADIPEVLRIMQPAVEKNILVPRTSAIMEEQLEDFFVYEVDGILHACGALHPYPSGSAEIAGVAVDQTYGGFRIGEKLVRYFLEEAAKAGLKKVFVLTTQAADWFAALGFRHGSKEELPQERRNRYDERRRSAVLLYDLPTTSK